MHTSRLTINKPTLAGDRLLACTYHVGEKHFLNTYEFPQVPTADPDSPLAKKLLQWVAIVTSFGLFSIDYFDELVCDFPIAPEDKAFFEKLIFLGFGEFRYTNHIEMAKKTILYGTGKTITAKPLDVPAISSTKGPFLLNGGGKDGSVSASLLTRARIDFTWFQRGNSAAQVNVARAWEAPTFQVIRKLDPNRRNRQYQGHRPISSSIAFLAILSAHLFGHNAVIASNESSANEGNQQIGSIPLNHQYSKSFEFEHDLQALLKRFDVPVHYFSLLRPLDELQIALLASQLTPSQLGAITSCNHGTKDATWCMACAKCAFVALVMTAVGSEIAEKIWGDRRTINQPGLRPYLAQILDPDVAKPLECVGTTAESQLAAGLILRHEPDLLDNETRAILAAHATAGDANPFTAMEKHAIPEGYQGIIADMRTSLSKLSIRLS